MTTQEQIVAILGGWSVLSTVQSSLQAFGKARLGNDHADDHECSMILAAESIHQGDNVRTLSASCWGCRDRVGMICQRHAP